MKRSELEHIIRASGAVAGVPEIVVVGSQAILGAHPEASDKLTRSMEADVFPLREPAKADLIDGSIGELSPFHEQFGYYAHGVSPETAILPLGWQQRLFAIRNENTGGTTGWCLAPVDLAVSKLVAGRPKDVEFVAALLGRGWVTEAGLGQGLAALPVEWHGRTRETLARCLALSARSGQ